jgi:hypothetical protein
MAQMTPRTSDAALRAAGRRARDQARQILAAERPTMRPSRAPTPRVGDLVGQGRRPMPRQDARMPPRMP